MDKNIGDGTLGAVGTNLGTVGTNVTAAEHGDENNHVTTLTLTNVAITIGDNAALSMGALIYTLPAGVINITAASGSVGLTLTTGTPTADTPEIAIGSVIAAGGNATTGDTSGAENIAGPHVMDDIAGTAELLDSKVAGGLFRLAGDVHTVFLNFADTWADVDDTAATASGTIHIAWTFLG